jgi:hypothetical protein
MSYEEACDIPVWRKSTFSQSGDCVEWAHDGDNILVRDSKDPHGPKLAFTRNEWRAFILGVVDGQATVAT